MPLTREVPSGPREKAMSGKLPHICFLAPNAYPLLIGSSQIEFVGGAELQQVTIARQLAARGYQVSMVCLDFGQDDPVSIDGITVLRGFHLKAGLPVLRFLWPRLTRIWRCLKRADADIYYQRAAGLWTGVMVAFCLRNGRRSIFAAAGNPDLDLVTSRIRYARDRRIYAYGLRHVDRIVVQNVEQKRLCRENHRREATVIPSLYVAPEMPVHSASRVVLWVSTIRNIKRPELFLELALAFPDLRFRMVGGPGRSESGLFEQVKSTASTVSNLQFLGFMPLSRVEEQFDEAGILINTSESEGFPNTFLQAWARGIPTISFVDAGAKLDGQSVGLRVDSMADMKMMLGRMSSNDELRMMEGQRCRSYFEKNHCPEEVLARYERLFAELMSSAD